MKILVLDNKIKVSLNNRLKNVAKWFNLDFQFTVKKTSFKNFPTQEDIDSNGNKFTRISDTFYDTNIVDKNYDCVILLIDKKDWVSGKTVQGYRTHNNLGVQEIVAIADDKSSYTFNGVKYNGDQLTWILIHELLHALYSKENKIDNTHKYFLLETPEKCLEDFTNLPIITPNLPINRWKHFKMTEKTGSLGHTVSELDPNFVDKLDELREICGFPFKITSGYRTVEENKKVGGVAGSAHIKRLAVDIACTDDTKRMKVIGEAYKLGFIGIGSHKLYIHLDLDSSKNKRNWLY